MSVVLQHHPVSRRYQEEAPKRGLSLDINLGNVLTIIAMAGGFLFNWYESDSRGTSRVIRENQVRLEQLQAQMQEKFDALQTRMAQIREEQVQNTTRITEHLGEDRIKTEADVERQIRQIERADRHRAEP